MRRRRCADDRRTTVMFIQSQSYFGADSQIHASMAEHLDRTRFKVLVACNQKTGPGSQALERISQIPDVTVIPVDFGPSRDETDGRRQLAITTIRRLPFLWGILKLARRARAEGVDIVHGTEKPLVPRP
jgi:hypothetical protein